MGTTWTPVKVGSNTKYTNVNKYDQFSVLTGENPKREFMSVERPDYVDLQYEVIVWCDYMEQVNKVVEQIVFFPSGFEQTSRQGFFFLIFTSFFEKRRFWRAMPGGHQRVVPTAPGSLFPKKRKKSSRHINSLIFIF